VKALSPKKYREKLNTYKNKFKGQRCFIVGNGPSLNKIDLNLLKKEYSFAVNGIFYKTDEMGYKPTFYVVEDQAVLRDNLDRINDYICDHSFFPSHYKSRLNIRDDMNFVDLDLGFYREFHPYYCKPRFSQDCSQVAYAGQSVTFFNMQLAFHLGFDKVYLIGMDFSYDIPDSTIIEGVKYLSQGADPNHFHPDYFGKGKVWHDPKLDRVAMNFNLARKVYEENGREIINATVGGKLELFRRVDFTSLFN